MATIPVFFTAELLPYHAISGSVVDEAVAAFNNELKGFFSDKGEFVIHEGTQSLVGLTYDASAQDPNVPVVIATLVGGFRGADAESSLSLAKTFSSKQFPQFTASLDSSSIATHPTGESSELPASGAAL